ncbi:putative monodehydroascorbate reductase [Hibiscus syriacus]|uniref:monodehydroascorbate reductase (NADH) n=1 Tax=Hibiscus syriacus TaxID=106335 RepID=A0A6A3BQ48_HIBSY|nr:putative monodehydroascorbate reductase [Hibiscus syriacus]
MPHMRPTLSKGFLLPEFVRSSTAPARLPTFHTCVGANEELLTPQWYEEHVVSVDVGHKTLSTASGETIHYQTLIIATGAQVLKLEEFRVSGSEAGNICYLRDLADANRLVNVIRSCTSGSAVVIGGGYLAMECAASLVSNKMDVTMVFPEAHCSEYLRFFTEHGFFEKIRITGTCYVVVPRLFTPKIATYYEDYYQSRGVKFIRGTIPSSFEFDSNGKVTAVNLRDGNRIPADMVVVGIGIGPNTSLFNGQFTMEKGGIKVNGKFQTSDSSVYAVGDVAVFPIDLYGRIHRLEHVDSARKSAKHAIAAILEPDKTGQFEYLPLFYSKAFAFFWRFYGDNAGEAVHFGDYSGTTFGAYWINNGRLVGSFLEGGTEQEFEAIANATRIKPAVDDPADVGRQGSSFALNVSEKTKPQTPRIEGETCSLVLEPTVYAWHATAGVVLAASVSAFAYWYGRRRRRW